MANDLSAFNAEQWSSRLVQRLDQVNVMLRLVNKDYEGDLRNSKTVWVRTPGDVTMSPYARGTQLNYEDLVPTKEAFTVENGSYFAFEIDDIDKAQSDISAMDTYLKRAVVAMNNEVESLILTAYEDVAVANRVSNGGTPFTLTAETTSGASLSVYDAFVRARTLLRKQNVPPTNLWAVVDPDTTALLFSDTKHFVRATELGDLVVTDATLGTEGIRMADGTVRPGFIGRCAGFDVFEVTQVPTEAGAKYLLFGDPEAISYAAQITEIEVLRLQNTFATACRGLLLHDKKVFAECAKRLVRIMAEDTAAGDASDNL